MSLGYDDESGYDNMVINREGETWSCLQLGENIFIVAIGIWESWKISAYWISKSSIMHL